MRSKTAQRASKGVALGALGALALVGILYLQTATYQFVWDDEQIIYGRADYRDPARWLEAITKPLDFSPNYFRPLALSTLLMQIGVWRDNPMPFHLANALIHLLNTALVMAIVGRWTHRGWAGVLGGLAYGLHPALVESVAFVSSRYDLLMTTFALLAIWLSIVWQGWKRAVGVGGAFLFALLSKEMAITLLVVLPLLLSVFALSGGAQHIEQRSRNAPDASAGQSRRQRLPAHWLAHRGVYAGLIVGFLLYLGLRWLSLGYLLTHNEAGAQIEAGTPLQHLLLVGRTFTTLIGLTFFPFFSITPAHHSNLPVPINDSWAWVQTFLGVLFLLGTGVLVWRAPKIGWLFVAAIMSLLPVLNLRPLEFAYGIFTAERFLTFPLALFVLGVSVGCLELFQRERARYGGIVVIPLWLVGAFVTTALTLPNWREPLAFWQWIARVSPQSPIGYSNLSDLYNKRGEYQLGLEAAERAIQIAPNSGMGWVNKGVSLLRLGDVQGAIEMFRKGTEIEPQNVIGWNNLAVMLSEQGKLDEAEAIIRKHVLGRPPAFMGHQALGLIYFRKGRPDLAEEQFLKAIEHLPEVEGSIPEEFLERLKSAEPWLASAYKAILANDLSLAEKLLKRAQSLNPDKISLGFVQGSFLLAQGKVAEAERIAQELVGYGYHDARLYELLALCAEKRGDRTRAQQLLQKAQQLAKPAP